MNKPKDNTYLTLEEAIQDAREKLLIKYIKWCKDNGIEKRSVYLFASENGIIIK